ncbi:MAG: hypothetical protein CSA52_01195 [Gammaproteobacteria bacterium]|nr:MAG: hypothetical protein CSB48_13105 [Pseudomonadota bacterium]PIE38796.1 MAG: hypothetical protein CSA52_01195 [Gammaproteobacteria bacterium]
MTLKSALLVDDSKLARITLKKLLEKRNLEVSMCASAQEALDYLKDNHPDVIFMDHLMPEMDGIEAMEKIRASPSTQHIPVVMCTGKEGGNYEEFVKQAGAIGFLAKPPESSQLENVLKRVDARLEAAPVSASAVDTEKETSTSAATDSDAIQVKLEALETRLMGRFQDGLSAVRARFEEQQARQAARPDLSDQIHSRLEQLTGRTDDIGSQFAGFENRMTDLSSELESMRDSLGTELDAVRESIKSAMTEQAQSKSDLDVSAVETRLEQKMGELVTSMDDRLAASVGQINEKIESVAATIPAETANAPSADELQSVIAEQAGKAVEQRLESVRVQQQSQISELREGIREQVINTLTDQSARGATDYSEEDRQQVSNLIAEVASLRQQLVETRNRSMTRLLALGVVAVIALIKAFGVF